MNAGMRTSDLTARLISVGLGALLSFCLFSASFVLPLAGPILSLLAPFPAMFSRFKYGFGAFAAVVVITAVLLYMGPGDSRLALVYVFQCGVIALLLSEFLLRNFSASRSIAWTTVAAVVICSVAVLATVLVTGQDFYQLHAAVVAEIRSNMSQILAIYEGQPRITADDLEKLKRAITLLEGALIRIYPALATLGLMFMSCCNMALVKRLSHQLGLRQNIGAFVNYRNPEIMIWFVIISGFSMLFGVEPITIAALNVLVICGALYFVQGMAVLFSLLSRFPASGSLRWISCLLLLLQPYLAILITTVGLFDLWGDFRTPRKRENL